jgi:predicted Zn-dependent protease
MEGLVRAESDARDGRMEIIPETAHLIESGEVKTPLRGIRILGNVRDLQRIDGIGRRVSLRPSLENGYPISEGAPPMRMEGILCLGMG